jgi:NAD(P) transhydrogenase
MNERFDFVVIGSGPAGEKAATQAAYFGKRVGIVERSATPGGVPVSNAGIPTKTLRETALYITGFRKRDVYGVRLELDPEATVERLRSRTGEVIRAMTETVRVNLERRGIELIHGHARLGSKNSVIVKSPDGSHQTLEADAILIATGSRPFHPPGIPFDDPDVYDSEDVMMVDRPLYRTVVIGGGAVGCEYASIFAALGVTVTLVDEADRLLAFFDSELSHLLAQSLREMGMRVLLTAGRASVKRDSGRLKVRLQSGEVLTPDQVLVAAGRVGNTEGLGLEGIGVDMDTRKRILVDETFRTTVDGIYAAGDVIGPPALASVSMEQGRVAACYAFDISFKKSLDPLPPFGVYSIPEVAMVGLTEEAAAAKGIDYEVGRGWFDRNARAVIAGATEGLVKLLFRRDTRELLGVHILGDMAAELIHHGQCALHFGATIDHFIHSTYNVPTESEAYKYAAYDGLQRLANQSNAS